MVVIKGCFINFLIIHSHINESLAFITVCLCNICYDKKSNKKLYIVKFHRLYDS